MANVAGQPEHATGIDGPKTTSLATGDPAVSTSALSTTTSDHPSSPPPPPNPSLDTKLIPPIASPPHSDEPPPDLLASQSDVSAIGPEVAVKLLARSVEALAFATGDIAATPAVTLVRRFGAEGILGSTAASHPAQKENSSSSARTPLRELRPSHSRTTSRPETPTPISDSDLKQPSFKPVTLSSPEAHPQEPPVPLVPTPTEADLASSPSAAEKARQEAAEQRDAQTAAIARKFFSKSIPPISLEAYLTRLQRYCPMSVAVWLAAAYYISVLGLPTATSHSPLVPLTPRTTHRLLLASLRVAMKALEDLRYPQLRFAGVGGVSENELRGLEISLCYLMDFELQVDGAKLFKGVASLQRAMMQADKMKASANGPGRGFVLMKDALPIRSKVKSTSSD